MNGKAGFRDVPPPAAAFLNNRCPARPAADGNLGKQLLNMVTLSQIVAIFRMNLASGRRLLPTLQHSPAPSRKRLLPLPCMALVKMQDGGALQIGAAAQVQLALDALPVGFHGLDADAQPCRHFAQNGAGPDQAKHL